MLKKYINFRTLIHKIIKKIERGEATAMRVACFASAKPSNCEQKCFRWFVPSQKGDGSDRMEAKGAKLLVAGRAWLVREVGREPRLRGL